MSHPFMEAVASGLAERGVATLRYQFPYMAMPVGFRIIVRLSKNGVIELYSLSRPVLFKTVVEARGSKLTLYIVGLSS